jgi:pimeloyl-ACP methyl ester carboxylesterase
LEVLHNEGDQHMNMAKDDKLRVPGATIFYRVRGSGPPPSHSRGRTRRRCATDGLCNQLIERYTVVTYDRRGLSGSKIETPDENLTLATHSDDAHLLLAGLTNESAFVFGSSISALIGLDLIVRHPRQVRVLVAHEPPAWELLSGSERASAMRLQEEAGGRVSTRRS